MHDPTDTETPRQEQTMIHDPRSCNAFHSATENVRDNGGEHVGYEAPITLDVLDRIAEDYVSDGLSECTCRAAVIRARYDLSFPAADGEVVTQGHRDYCHLFGHGTHYVADEPRAYCPRCGDLKTTATTTDEADELMIGTRVEIPAHTDYWMQGDRFGEVTATRENSAGVVIATVDMDRSGKRRKFRADVLRSVSA